MESVLRHDVGCSVELPEALDPFVALFSESAARAVVAVAPEAESRFTDLCTRARVPCARLGTTGGDLLDVRGQFRIPLGELRSVWSATLPALYED